MPTSKVMVAGNAPSMNAYGAALDAFLATHVTLDGGAGVVQAYAAVQSMPYHSGNDRTPLAALLSGRGACTAKHLVLRDVLRRVGCAAEVEIVEGDFASGIPVHPTMSAELQAMVRDRGITDFHCRVRLGASGEGPALDATWPPALAKWGFPVEAGWSGTGDTLQAIADVTVRARDEDVLGTKARLLAALSEEDSARRLKFLGLLSAWLGTLPHTATEND